jgi:hypothetical protein
MTTMIIFHEVKNGDHWAKAWQKGAGSRHEMFAKIGTKVRTFQVPQNPNSTGVLLEVPDMEKCQTFLESDEGKKAMEEDGLKIETIRILNEITP